MIVGFPVSLFSFVCLFRCSFEWFTHIVKLIYSFRLNSEFDLFRLSIFSNSCDSYTIFYWLFLYCHSWLFLVFLYSWSLTLSLPDSVPTPLNIPNKSDIILIRTIWWRPRASLHRDHDAQSASSNKSDDAHVRHQIILCAPSRIHVRDGI